MFKNIETNLSEEEINQQSKSFALILGCIVVIMLTISFTAAYWLK